jgi:hypothetical protein
MKKTEELTVELCAKRLARALAEILSNGSYCRR